MSDAHTPDRTHSQESEQKMLKTETVVITPDMARAMLEKDSHYQRAITWSKVNKYAEMMSNGKFPLTAQSIVIGTDGTIINGRHRLHAIIVSGVPVELQVTTGEDPANFGYYDIGLKRTASQFIGGRQRSLISAATQFVMSYEQNPGMPGGSFTRLSSMWTIDEVVSAAESRPGLAELAPAVSITSKATRINGPILLAVTYLGGSHAPDLVEPWLYGLTTGADLNESDARLHLRNAYARNYKALNVTSGRRQGWAYITRAWNAFAADEPVKLLRYNSEHSIPPIAGTV